MAVLLQIKNATKSYGNQVLLDNAEATLSEDVKYGFVGRNGAGKSTLLRILLGEEDLDTGEVTRHPKLQIGYLRQHDPFLPGETAQEFLMRDSGQPDWKCGEVAGQFELKGAYLEGPIAKLSGDGRRVSNSRPSCFMNRICCCSTNQPTSSTCEPRSSSSIFYVVTVKVA